MKEFTYPIERTRAVNLLGKLWTGSLSGVILVVAMMGIGFIFLGTEDFSWFSIIFFFGFIIPFSIFFHLRLVRRGGKLMRTECQIRFNEEEGKLYFLTGFPNTNDPNWQGVEITDDNRDIELRGNELGGYHLRVVFESEEDEDGNPHEPIRLGLWLDIEEAKQRGQELADTLGGEFSINTEGSPTGDKELDESVNPLE